MTQPTRTVRVNVTGDTDQLGRAVDQGTRHVRRFDAELDRHRATLARLEQQVRRTGDVQIFRDINKQRRVIKQFEQIGSEAADAMSVSLVARIGPLLARTMPAAINPAVAGVLVGATAAALPLMGATIAGAVVGAAGVGGVIGGLVLAGQDQRVADRAQALADRIGAQLRNAALPMVPAALEALDIIDRNIRNLDPLFRRVFDSAAVHLRPLVEGVSRGLTAALQGAVLAVERAGPVFAVIAAHAERFGQIIGQAFETLSEGAAEGALALHDILTFLEIGIRGFIEFAGALAKAYGFMRVLFAPDKIQAVAEFTTAELNAQNAGSQMAETLRRQADSFKLSASAAEQATQRNKELTEALYGVANQSLNTMRAQDAYAAALDNASDAIDENGKTFNRNTEAGRRNREAMFTLAEQANRLSRSILEETGSQDKATDAAEAGRRKFVELATRMGVSRDRARELAEKLIAIPKNNNIKITSEGYPAVRDQLARLSAYQQALKKGIRVAGITGAGGFSEFAAGGAVRGPGTGTSDSIPAWLSTGEHVLTAAEVAKMGGHAAVERLRSMVRSGQVPAFATGGAVGMPFPTTARMADIPTLDEVRRAVAPLVDGWRGMVAAIRIAFPSLGLISGFRRNSRTLSGSLSYHALGRAVDYPPSFALARWIDLNYPNSREIITPWQQFNRWNGRRHRFTGAVWNQHNFAGGNAHVHWAMAGGGLINEPVYGIGLNSGASYSFGERGPETVVPGASGGHVTVVVNLDGRPFREYTARVVHDELMRDDWKHATGRR